MPGAVQPSPASTTSRGTSTRLAPLLLGAALLLVAAVAAGWWWTQWRQPGRAAPAAAATVAPVQKPPAPDPAALRRQSEATAQIAQATEQARLAAIQQEVDQRLGQARDALAAKHYEEAATAASAVLGLAPGNPDAQGILTAVDKAAKRRRDRAAQQAALPKGPKPAENLAPLPQSTPAATIATPVPTDATLAVNFFTNLPEGVLVVYVNNSQVMRESFEYYTKTGFLRSKPSKGRVQQDIKVAVGTAEIRVYVTYGGKRTEVKNLSGNFPGGSKRTLSATLNEDGSLSARLE